MTKKKKQLEDEEEQEGCANGEIHGLKEWPRENRPNVPIVFWAFRLMIFLGIAMLGIVLLSLYLRWRSRLYDSDWF